MSSQEKIRIVVLEDNAFYNRIFTEKMRFFLESFRKEKPFRFELDSYQHGEDFMNNLKIDTDLAFVDYYLDNGDTALKLIRKIQYRCPECKIIVLSQFYSLKNSLTSIFEGASDFLQKGVHAIPESCRIAGALIERRIKYGF